MCLKLVWQLIILETLGDKFVKFCVGKLDNSEFSFMDFLSSPRVVAEKYKYKYLVVLLVLDKRKLENSFDVLSFGFC